MNRQLIVLCDGTNNNLTGGCEDTHVVRVAELLRQHPDTSRLVHYDPGVGHAGNLPGTTVWDQCVRFGERVAGLAFGRGVFENMVESYLFLMRHYRPDDEIFIFGFSRGAFTARSVAGLVNQFGILQPHQEGMVSTLVHTYFSSRDNAQFKATAEQTVRLFGGGAPTPVELQFVGVWDTVASVGMWPFGLRISATPSLEGKRYLHVRQALALDEQRAQFKPRLYAADNGVHLTASKRQGSLMQLWFRGDHCDVGGGHALAEGALSRDAFAWLLSEAAQCGLRLGALSNATEVQMLQAAAALPAPLPADSATLLHSQPRATPWWALTGLAVRRTVVELAGQTAGYTTPQAHPQVQRWAHAWPQRTAWASALPWKAMASLLAVMAVLMLAMGQLLHGLQPHSTPWAGFVQLGLQASDYLQSNADFALWQLQGPVSGAWACEHLRACKPRAAVLWDFALIAAYAYLLACWASWAFARLAALRPVQGEPRRWLNVLGLALPLMVFADVGENLFTLAVLTLEASEADALGFMARVAMAACSLAKWAGAAGVLALVVCGVFARPKAAPR